MFQKTFPNSPIALPPTILEAMYGESKPLLDAPQTGLHMVRAAIPCRSNSKLLKRNGHVLQLSAPNRGAPHLDQIGQIVTQVIGSIFPQRGRNTPPRGSEERLGGGARVEEVGDNDGAIVVSGRGGPMAAALQRYQQEVSHRGHSAEVTPRPSRALSLEGPTGDPSIKFLSAETVRGTPFSWRAAPFSCRADSHTSDIAKGRCHRPRRPPIPWRS